MVNLGGDERWVGSIEREWQRQLHSWPVRRWAPFGGTAPEFSWRPPCRLRSLAPGTLPGNDNHLEATQTLTFLGQRYIFEEKTCKHIPGRRLAQSQCFPSLDYWFISCVGMIWNQSDLFPQEKWPKSSSQASFVGVQKFPVVLLSRRSRARIHCCASRATHCSVPVMWWAIFICKHWNGFLYWVAKDWLSRGDLCL